MIVTLHCAQCGASAWMAQANESNVWVVPPIVMSKVLSYSLWQVSHVFMRQPSCKARALLAF
jgi:hypothetical protein